MKRYFLLTMILLLFSAISYGQNDNNNKRKIDKLLKIEKMEKIVLSIKFTTTVDNKEIFKQVLIDLFEKISKEPHFVNAVIHEGVDKKNEFLVYETWNMNFEDFLKLQMTKPYMSTFEQSLKTLQVTRDPAIYNPFIKYGKLD